MQTEKRNTYLINERRQDRLLDIHPQIRLKLQAPLAIKQQAVCDPRSILPETHICRILAHSLEPIPDRREQVIEVVVVLVFVELTSRIVDVVAAVVAVRLKDAPSSEHLMLLMTGILFLFLQWLDCGRLLVRNQVKTSKKSVRESILTA
jgi:hypothetical protein